MAQLTALQTENGPTYLDIGSIVFVSAPFHKKSHEPARIIGLLGGHRAYVLDNNDNRLKLGALLPPDAAFMAADSEKKKRGRKPKAKAEKTTDAE
jgi:hypothetical protein